MSLFATALLMLAMQAAPLQGIVFKKATNEPLSDATVELRQDQENGAVVKKLTTEDDGRFRCGGRTVPRGDPVPGESAGRVPRTARAEGVPKCTIEPTSPILA